MTAPQWAGLEAPIYREPEDDQDPEAEEEREQEKADMILDAMEARGLSYED